MTILLGLSSIAAAERFCYLSSALGSRKYSPTIIRANMTTKEFGMMAAKSPSSPVNPYTTQQIDWKASKENIKGETSFGRVRPFPILYTLFGRPKKIKVSEATRVTAPMVLSAKYCDIAESIIPSFIILHLHPKFRG